MTETIAYIRNSLKDIYPPGEAQALVRLIMERVCGLSTHQLLLGKGKELSDTEKFKIKEIVEGLRLYKPIQYLLGIADFYGIEFKVTPDVLIPRPETAELVERIITDYRGQAPRILDIGTGSGGGYITRSARRGRGERPTESSFRIFPRIGYPFRRLSQFHARKTKVSRRRNKSFT